MDRDTGLPIAEAAARLGISPAALRKRIKRGSVRAYKVDGKWYAILPGGVDADRDAGSTRDRPAADPEIVAELRRQIAYLEQALAREQANVQMIAQRALPAPSTAADVDERGQGADRRAWWQFWK